jgi:hypothetical protein
MTRMLTLCVFLLAVLSSPATSVPPDSVPQAQCFNNAGDGTTVKVTRIVDRPRPSLRLIGVVNLANGIYFARSSLRLREAGFKVVWQGKDFLLKVHTNRPAGTDQFLGRFRGRDDAGHPVVLRDLSCTLFIPLP